MTELVREIMIDATRETIWPFLVDAGKMTAWMGTEAELDPRPGGTFRVLVQGIHPGHGEYVDVVPLEKVAFTFGWAEDGNPIVPGSTTVEISLHPEGSKTLVRLTHRGLPDAAAVEDHSKGWAHYLERLAITATGGDAGPDQPTGAKS
jgi:uncharacterized protein YndB with AHSA1/START domain